MTHKTVSCSFADCRGPSYARWLRRTLVAMSGFANLTFLVCRDHDEELASFDDLDRWSLMRIGLYEDEVCFHDPHVLRSREFAAELEGEL